MKTISYLLFSLCALLCATSATVQAAAQAAPSKPLVASLESVPREKVEALLFPQYVIDTFCPGRFSASRQKKYFYEDGKMQEKEVNVETYHTPQWESNEDRMRWQFLKRLGRALVTRLVVQNTSTQEQSFVVEEQLNSLGLSTDDQRFIEGEKILERYHVDWAKTASLFALGVAFFLIGMGQGISAIPLKYRLPAALLIMTLVCGKGLYKRARISSRKGSLQRVLAPKVVAADGTIRVLSDDSSTVTLQPGERFEQHLVWL